jgi:2-iminobutanoate/2-iminopropanoate deaminase
MRKSVLWIGLLAIVATGTAVAQAPSSAKKPVQKQVLRPEGAPTNLPFSPGIVAGDLVFVAGQGTRDPKTGQHPATWEDQVRRSIENVRAVLMGGGMDLSNVVSCHAYFADLNDRPRMNKVYGGLFNVNPPVRTAVEVVAMPDDARLEMTCIAARELEARKVPGRGTVRVGDWVFTSGTTGGVSGGKMAEDFEGQAKQTLENLSATLSGANLAFKDVVWANVYLDDPANQPALEKIWDSYFKAGPKPARAIQIVSLGPTTHVEITLLAADPSLPRRAVRNGSVLAGKTLFVSEQLAPGLAIEDQVTGIMKKLQQALSAAKMKMSDVVNVNVYLKDLADFPRMNAVYRKHFAEKPPARTTVQVKQASPGTLVKISCVAVK